MPSGISERLIQRALGPIDFSYAYQKVENTAKQLAAEDRARKQEAAKEYYADIAAMAKEKAGVRAADIPEITEDYNKWSAIKKQLSANPNLITKNPEIYGKLTNEADELYGKILTKTKGSKELAAEEKSFYSNLRSPEKVGYYKINAADEFRKNVLNNTWSEVQKNDFLNPSIYAEPRIDGKDFYNKLSSNVRSNALAKEYVKPDLTFKGVPGEKKNIVFENMPQIDLVQNEVVKTLKGAIQPRNLMAFSESELNDAKDSKDFQKTVAEYELFYDDNNPNGWKKYFNEKPPKANLFQHPDSPTATFADYMTAKEFLSRRPLQGVEKIDFAGSAKMRYGAQLSMRNALALKKIKGADGKEQQIVSLTPAFRVIASGGETGKQMAIQASNEFNTIGFAEQLFPFTPVEKEAAKESAYMAGTEIMKNLYGDVTVGGAGVERDYSTNLKKMDELANKINQENKKNGFRDSDVTGKSLLSGKTMVFVGKDKDNKDVGIVLNTQGKNSPRFMESRVKLPQMKAEGKRGYVTSGIEAAGGGVDMNLTPDYDMNQ